MKRDGNDPYMPMDMENKDIWEKKIILTNIKTSIAGTERLESDSLKFTQFEFFNECPDLL